MRTTLVGAGAHGGEEKTFGKLFTHLTSVVNAGELGDIDVKDSVILFRGGQDINPMLYNEKRVVENGADSVLSIRDKFERELFNFAVKHAIPMIGICRGAQFVCAMSGGKLVQHCDRHGGNHHIVTASGKTMLVTSTHHQMMYPVGTKHKLIAWAAPKRSNVYIMSPTDQRTELYAEPEIVYFEETKALGIQGHPEYLTETHPFWIYSNELVKELIQ